MLLSLKYLILFSFSFFLSVLLNSILLKFSKNLGKRNTGDFLIRWANEQKPSLGGISFYIVFLISYSIYTIFFDQVPGKINFQNVGLLMSFGIAFLMGLSDDAYNTKPILKFSVQVGCGLILISSGTFITLSQSMILNYLFTVFWVVAVMNSINMLDNMDGITTSVAIVIISTALGIGFISGDAISNSFMICSLLSMLAALFGFLIFNWNPSKMFMGDTGSQFLGVFLAAIGIIYFWNYKVPGAEEFGTQQLGFVGLAFIVPIIDTTSVVINRLRRGQSPFVGGKDHTTHHLSYHGLSDRKVAMVMIGLSTVSMSIILLTVKFVESWNLWYAFGLFSYLALNFIWIYRITRVHKMHDIVNHIKTTNEKPKIIKKEYQN
jgi:UDP-GlcNAc:undecaprenyl-phosphate GlcNAc-1-phosphate transferase